MSKKDFLERLIELCTEDEELHEGLVGLIRVMTGAERARAEWYRRRTK